ncbi:MULTISPECIES: NADAR family protein [unclassified Myroides]|uniref:NADAR family protein n=1 Tax=unclassified Myroides TaxID=2642485 RepID=UPI003D2F9678
MTKFEFFYGTEHPLSQWYGSKFSMDGIEFNSMEQWMMYSKAILFKDFDTAKKILEEDNPSIQRKLGRQVKFFKDDIWIEHRESIIYQGNYAKFNQNEELKRYLLNTENAYLAEASPTDLIWGIGYGITDEERLFPEKWRGENLLGKILMQVREDLKIG